MNNFKELNAQWIWLPQQCDAVNQYVDFRLEFDLEEMGGWAEGDGLLRISVDTEYAVWLNGEFVDFNQYDDFPHNKAYDVLDVRRLLRRGKNALCVLAYHQGQNSYQYIKGRPGLIYALKAGAVKVASGSSALCRQSPAYRSGEVEKVSPQLLFTFHYDAGKYDGWKAAEYKSGAEWAQAAADAGMTDAVTLYGRPNKKLVLGSPAEGRIAAQGFFRRMAAETWTERKPTTAELMQSDYLSARRAADIFGSDGGGDPQLPCGGLRIGPAPAGDDGVYVLVDLMREEAGLFSLDINAEAGAVIDAAYGEQLDDLRVRASVGGRNFAFSYACREGRQQFTHYFKRIAGRYVQLHIRGIRQGITLYYAGLRPAGYPLEMKGSFVSSDRLFNRIHDVSARTLALCMHEHYEDTPWREQALYAMDSRNQALCGYYCFGEYDFSESSFSLFAENLGQDGMIEICAPAKDRITIPSFSMAWIMAIRDLVLFSGRIGTAKRLLPAVKKMLDSYIGRMECGLMKTPEGCRYWNFYEWADGLDDTLIFSNPDAHDAGRLDAPLNLFFCLALEAGGQLAGWAGDNAAEANYFGCLAEVKQAFHRTFWDESQKAYRTYCGKNCASHFAELTQALALCCGAVPADCAGIVRARLADKQNGLVRTTLSYAIYKYEALLQEPGKYGGSVFEDIAADWGYMLYSGATSFWETIKGADDFDKAGSLCHGWSAVPLYFFYAYVLGIKPLSPGFAQYERRPLANIGVTASGRVPTPAGEIVVNS